MSDKKSLLPALITQSFYYVLFIFSMFDYGYSEQGFGPAIFVYILSFVSAFISILFHILGAILNISRNKKLIPIIYLILAVLSIPLLITVGTSYSTVDIIIWNAYYLILFLVPLFFCLKKHI